MSVADGGLHPRPWRGWQALEAGRRRFGGDPADVAVIALTVVGVLLGIAAVIIKGTHYRHSASDTAITATGGFLFLCSGAVAHARRRDNRVGLLMADIPPSRPRWTGPSRSSERSSRPASWPRWCGTGSRGLRACS